MTTPLRRRLRLARRGAWYAVAVVLVLMALAAGALSRLLPLAERHPDRVAAWLAERAGRPVAFDRLDAEWTRRGPLLRFDGLRVGDGDDAVRIGAAEMLVSQYAGLLPGRSFTELRLRGLQLTLERGGDGRWSVHGLPGEQRPGADPFAALERLGELQVIGGRLTLLAPALGIETALPKIDLRLQVDGDRVRTAARAWIREDAAPLDFAADLDRRAGDGRAHAAAMRADLAAWSPLLRFAGVAVEDGDGRAQVWAQLRDKRVTTVTVDADLDGLALRGSPVADGGAPPRMRFEQLRAQARWQLTADGWRVDAPTLRIGAEGAPQVLDGLALAGGRHFALRAARLDAGPLLAALALGDRLDAGLRGWLLAAAPDARLADIAIAIAGGDGGRVRASARIESLRFGTVGDTPGLDGLAGALTGDEQGFRFVPDPSSTVRFDWPSGFGAPHRVKLRGDIAGWRDGEGMQVATPALRVDGEGYAADVRGGLWFQNDGTHPAIDLAATLDDAQVPIAKRFWVRHLMPDAAEHWLDDALVGGSVRNGRAVVSGDLDDWPFSSLDGHESRGLFRAEAQLVDAVVKFQPDWPAADHLSGDAVFVNDGFSVKGRAQIAGVGVPALEARLEHYGQARLDVSAQAGGDAGKLLALLRASPLRKGLEDTFDSLSASGPVAATFALGLPLHGGKDAPEVAGEVELRGAKLGDKRWHLEFEQVRGHARYDRHGFASGPLAVVRDGQAGTLALRAGEGHVRDAGQAFEAELDAALTAADLLQHAPDLAWLQPRVRGRSQWQVAVAIARAQPAARTAPVRLQLRSSLAGTALDLPEPLQKPAAAALPTTIATTLPLGEGEIEVDFGGRLALRARSSPAGTGVRVALGASRVPEAPPASGLAAAGRTPVFDALDWASLAPGGGDGKFPLRGIDVSAGQLRMLGASFADARVQATPAQGGTRLRFDAAGLAGELQVPQDARAAVVGRFERVHWRGADPASAATAPRPPAAATAGRDAVDPAKIPPLQLDIDDFRFGELALGSLVLRTRPTPDGLRIEQLQARSPTQRIDASGSWTGGAAARTRLDIDADSRDFGALMAGLGFGRSIAGGEGELRFNAQWPRSPSDFALGAMQGDLSLTIKDGRLAEVEPGAGRVLGLLSVAQLPRRLMLDFRDFFSKGFAFDRIGGHVRFAGGLAQSDDMVIDGPAAEIRMRGRSDLRAQTHDQTIEVLPKTGNLLPAVGAIAGGPVGAAVGAVANAVLKRPLGEMGAKTYRVSGPWKEPKVEVVEHRTSPQAAAVAPGPPARD